MPHLFADEKFVDVGIYEGNFLRGQLFAHLTREAAAIATINDNRVSSWEDTIRIHCYICAGEGRTQHCDHRTQGHVDFDEPTQECRALCAQIPKRPTVIARRAFECRPST